MNLHAVPDDVKLCDFVETYWRLHAIPNLSPASRDLYARIWSLHILPRLGDYGVRELTPKRLTRFRAELERGGLGTATVVKAMTIVQSILSFAVGEELVEYTPPPASRSLITRGRESRTSSCRPRSRRSEPDWTSATARSSRCSRTAARAPRRSSAASRGTTSATERSATSTPSAIARAMRRC